MTAADSHRRKPDLLATFFVGLSVVLFLISLTQRPYEVDRSDSTSGASFILLLIGWLGPAEHVFAWYANPLLLAALVLIWGRRWRVLGIISGLAALGLSLTFLGEKDILWDEAGHRAKIVSHGRGYWLWVGSISIALFGCMVATARDLLRSGVNAGANTA